MNWKSKLRKEPDERDPAPVVAATAFLLMAVASFWVPNDGIAQTLRDSGIISAIFCVVYWLAAGRKG